MTHNGPADSMIYAASTLWMPSGEELARLGPLWALVGTIVAILIAALVVGRNWRVPGAIATIGALVTAWLCVRGFDNLPAGGWGGLSPDRYAPMLIADQFSAFGILLVSVFMVAITIMWFLGQDAGLPEQEARRGDAVEFFVLFVGSAFGMALMFSTANLLMIILAVEMASLPSYALAGFRKRHPLASEASLKYILFGAITSATMIYGASLLYGQYHTFDVGLLGQRIAAHVVEDGPTLFMGVAVCAFLVGIAFKVSAVPFHFWCPDVFQGASYEVTTWLSVASKAAGVGLMLRVIMVLTAATDDPVLAIDPQQALVYVTTAIAIVAAITATVGNLAAFRQDNIKRLLAYSSIAHAGYMLMAVAVLWRPAAGVEAPAHPGFAAVVAYLVVYVLMNLAAFLVAAMVYWSTGREDLEAFRGLAWRNTPMAIALAVCLFSLVGLPPLGGFFAKYWLLWALFEADNHLIWLVFVAVFNTLISLYYYVRVVRVTVQFDDSQMPVRAPALGQLIVLACAVGILLTGTVWAGWLKNFADARSRSLYVSIEHRQAPTETVEAPVDVTEVAEAGAAGTE